MIVFYGFRRNPFDHGNNKTQFSYKAAIMVKWDVSPVVGRSFSTHTKSPIMHPFEPTEQDNIAERISTVKLERKQPPQQPPSVKLGWRLEKTGNLSLKARIHLAHCNGGIADEVKDLLLEACNGFEQDDTSRMVRMARALGVNAGCCESAEFMEHFFAKAGVGFNLGTWSDY